MTEEERQRALCSTTCRDGKLITDTCGIYDTFGCKSIFADGASILKKLIHVKIDHARGMYQCVPAFDIPIEPRTLALPKVLDKLFEVLGTNQQYLGGPCTGTPLIYFSPFTYTLNLVFNGDDHALNAVWAGNVHKEVYDGLKGWYEAKGKCMAMDFAQKFYDAVTSKRTDSLQKEETSDCMSCVVSWTDIYSIGSVKLLPEEFWYLYKEGLLPKMYRPASMRDNKPVTPYTAANGINPVLDPSTTKTPEERKSKRENPLATSKSFALDTFDRGCNSTARAPAPASATARAEKPLRASYSPASDVTASSVQSSRYH